VKSYDQRESYNTLMGGEKRRMEFGHRKGSLKLKGESSSFSTAKWESHEREKKERIFRKRKKESIVTRIEPGGGGGKGRKLYR